jgi:hypothetical protein
VTKKVICGVNQLNEAFYDWGQIINKELSKYVVGLFAHA